MRGKGAGVNRAEGAKIWVIYVDFMDNRAEGAKFFGIQVGGRGGREGLIYLMGQDLAEKNHQYTELNPRGRYP